MASRRETLIASAEKSLSRGKVEAALGDYQKVLEETPGDIGILNKVGDLLVRLNRNDESITYFIRIAEHYAKDGFHVKAIAMYKKVNRLDPARLDVYERLAELYGKQGLGMEAKSQYQVLADHYLKQDNTGGAIAIFQKMVQADASNIQLHVKLADLFTQGRRVPEALKEYAIVAGMLRDRSAHAEAVQVYEKALKLAPDNVEILKSLIPLLLETGNVQGARAHLRKALETTPRSIPLFILASDAALMANDVADARAWATKAQAVDPESEEVLNAVVKVQLKARRPDLAFPAAASLADLAVRRGEFRRALGLLAPIAKLSPDNADLLKKIVDIAHAAGDDVSTVPYRSILAELYRKDGRLSEAAEMLRSCSRLAPDNPEFRTRLAVLEPAAPAAAAAPPLRRDEPLHERAVTLPGYLLQPGDRPVPAPSSPLSPPSPPSPVPPPPQTVEPEPIEAADEFEFDLEDSSAALKPVLPPPASAPPSGGHAVEMPHEVDDAIEVAEEHALPAPGGWTALPTLEEMAEAALAASASHAASNSAPPGAEDSYRQRLRRAPPPIASLDFPEAPVEPRPAPGPAPSSSMDLEIDEALVESHVFRKYGLLEKALDRLGPVVGRYPENERVRERLFEIYLEQGNRFAARTEAEALAGLYQADGRSDRIRGIEALFGEPLEGGKPAPLPVPAPVLEPAAEPATEEAAEPVAEAAFESFPAAFEAPLEVHPEPTSEPSSETLTPPPEPLPAEPLPPPTPPVAVAPPTPDATVAIRPERPKRRHEIDLSDLLEPTPHPAPPKARQTAGMIDIAAQLRDLVRTKSPRHAPPPKALDVPVAREPEPIPAPAPADLPVPAAPLKEDLAEIDFCLDQGMVVDAAERLQGLEARFPGDPEVTSRRKRLEGSRGTSEDSRPMLKDLLAEDLESVLDAELGRALTDQMVREAVPAGVVQPPAPVSPVDDSGLFSDEQEFFNLAEELQAELKSEEIPTAPDMGSGSGNVSLEEIFREFKKGVEQQLSPEDHETHYNLGIAYKEMGLTDEAIGEFQVASKDPAHAVECCSMLGLCFLEKGLPQLAVKWYLKGLETPGIKDAEKLGLQYDLASLHAELGDRAGAYKVFLEIYGTNASFRDVGDRLKELSPAV